MAVLIETKKLENELRKMRKEGAVHCWQEVDGSLVAGNFPTVLSRFDFQAEKFVAGSIASPPNDAESERVSIDKSHEAGRRTKLLVIFSPEREITVRSVKQAWEEWLREVEICRPGSLPKLVQLAKERRRSKQMLATSIDRLYEQEALHQYSTQIVEGFFAATNNSEGEVVRFLKAATHSLGLKSTDFYVLDENGEKWY